MPPVGIVLYIVNMFYFDEEVFEGHILIFLNYLGTSMGSSD